MKLLKWLLFMLAAMVVTLVISVLAAEAVCLPPGVQEDEVYKDIIGQGYTGTPFGPGVLIQFTFRDSPAHAIFVEHEGSFELVHFHPEEMGEDGGWYRDDPSVCTWRRAGVPQQSAGRLGQGKRA